MKDTAMTIPAVVLRGMTILPGMIAHFDISRNRSMRAVEAAMVADQRVFLVTQRDIEQESPGIEGLYRVGIVADVKQVIKLQNDIVRILVEGTHRAEAYGYTDREEYVEAQVVCFGAPDEGELPQQAERAMVMSVQETFVKYARIHGKIGQDVLQQVGRTWNLSKLLDYVGNNLPVRYSVKQKILEAVSLTQRYEVLLGMLLQEIEVLAIKSDFQNKVQERVERHQKEYVLREQMSLIKEELGETNTDSDAENYEKQLAALDCPDEVREKIKKEITRFKGISANSSESTVSRGYIETLLELPWNRASEDNRDLTHAEHVLDQDHYGLEKVKERMIEFLAVRNLTSKGESPIICLVGPPGTGKTSIARSIARALNKKYVRVSLGGVRDEAEIRGHRRTYVGAMPGRIVAGLRTVGVKNPLMLLDEIDKVSSDYKGDTSAALLEVLDGEQNSRFRDHYVELPVDLSEVLFIATANSVQDIPRPLLDRMELIEVSSYTENEKFHIAKEHLMEKQLTKNGIQPAQLKISDKAMQDIIHFYTREAGVRDLERKLGEVCRKAAKRIYQGEAEKLRVSKSNLEDYLGKKKYRQDKKNQKDEVGIVRGLAWTSVGGVTLEIEVNVMPGKGELVLTGKLGDVMKESARAGISYIRSISADYGIDADYFKEHDIHIHIPEGAVPKDGPSAGITMALAMLSAVTGRPVRADIAMTGEITLRGRVLPIGGLKEKLLAAKNAGIRTVCVPKENEKDLSEISEEITEGMEILFVEHMNQVIKAALA
ncbi:MAG: endopeptidase La [Blautia sp.]|nr:endopeptidase La [Blautia sp.]